MWDAVVTVVFADKKIPAFDADVLQRMDAEEGTEKAVKAERMRIGVRNDAGEIYRAIGVTGMGCFLDTIQALAGLGLTDELQRQTGTREGYDAIFRPS